MPLFCLRKGGGRRGEGSSREWTKGKPWDSCGELLKVELGSWETPLGQRLQV